MKKFLLAIQFLTVIPIRSNWNVDEKDFGGSLVYFPAVGLVIGGILAGTAWLSASLPRMVSAAIILNISVLITGGIHLDGLADSFDGLYGHRPRERRLEIMRDSRLGVMGVLAVICVLLLKFALLAEIKPEKLYGVLVLTPVFGRWTQVLACRTFGYARQDGKAKSFMKYCNTKHLIAASVFTAVVFMFLAGRRSIFLFFGSLPFMLVFLIYVRRKLGGMTGDTIGAASEIAETAILFVFLVMSH